MSVDQVGQAHETADENGGEILTYPNDPNNRDNGETETQSHIQIFGDQQDDA